MSNLIPDEDQERQVAAFKAATEGSPRVLAQRKRRTGLAVQFHPEHAAHLSPIVCTKEQYGFGGTTIEWDVFGAPLAPGDYIVNVSGEGIRVISRAEFENEWEVVGDA